MNRALDSFLYVMAMAAIFVFLGLVGSGFYWLFELLTGHTANIFKLAGF